MFKRLFKLRLELCFRFFAICTPTEPLCPSSLGCLSVSSAREYRVTIQYGFLLVRRVAVSEYSFPFLQSLLTLFFLLHYYCYYNALHAHFPLSCFMINSFFIQVNDDFLRKGNPKLKTRLFGQGVFRGYFCVLQ